MHWNTEKDVESKHTLSYVKKNDWIELKAMFIYEVRDTLVLTKFSNFCFMSSFQSINCMVHWSD